MKKASTIGMGLLLALAASAHAADGEYQPKQGYWHQVLLLTDAAGKSHPFLVSEASYPETCVTALRETAARVEEAGGIVWTDKAYRRLSFEREAKAADLRHEVIEFKCVFRASSD